MYTKDAKRVEYLCVCLCVQEMKVKRLKQRKTTKNLTRVRSQDQNQENQSRIEAVKARKSNKSRKSQNQVKVSTFKTKDQRCQHSRVKDSIGKLLKPRDLSCQVKKVFLIREME